MKKLLLKVEIEYDEESHSIKADVENRGNQSLSPVAIANLISASAKDEKDPIAYQANLVLQVIDHLSMMAHVDMTTIDIRALTQMGGGGHGREEG